MADLSGHASTSTESLSKSTADTLDIEQRNAACSKRTPSIKQVVKIVLAILANAIVLLLLAWLLATFLNSKERVAEFKAPPWNNAKNEEKTLPMIAENITISGHSPDRSVESALLRAAKLLQSSIDDSVDPCDDFFQFTCGKNGAAKHYENVAEDTKLFLGDKIFDHLNDQKLSSMRKVLTAWKNLLFVKTTKKEGQTNLNGELKKYLSATGMKCPCLTNSERGNITAITLSKAIGYLSASRGIDVLLKAEVSANPLESTHNRHHALFVSPVEAPSRELQATLGNIFAWSATMLNLTGSNLRTDVSELLDGINFVAKAIGDGLAKDDDADEIDKEFAIADLQENVPSIDWLALFEQLTVDAPSDIRERILNHPRFRFFFASKVSFNRLEDMFAALTQSEWIDDFLCLNFVMGQENSRDLYGITEAPNSHDSYVTVFSHVFARLLAEHKLPTAQQRDEYIKALALMTETITQSYSAMFRNIANAHMRHVMSAKLADLARNYLYPSFIFNDTALDEFYGGLEDITARDKQLQTMLKVRKFMQYQKYSLLLSSAIDRADFDGFSQSAYYSRLSNAINIPINDGTLSFSEPLWPASLRYGSDGFTIGHEIGHAFDSYHIQFDKNDDLWANAAGRSWLPAWYNKKISSCLISQYSEFCESNEKYVDKCIDGKLTLDENIADNSGLQAAFQAYEMERSREKSPFSVPGFERYTHDQLFFISYGISWCMNLPKWGDVGRTTPDEDEHSPPSVRVLLPLRNSPEFQKAFNCPASSKMVAKKWCDVWR